MNLSPETMRRQMLTDEQKHAIALSLGTLLVVGHQEDSRTISDPAELGEMRLLRIFACSFACNHTKYVTDAQEAHSLCDEFFRVLSALLSEHGDFSDQELQHLEHQLQERFTEYYRATRYIGQASETNVPLNLTYFRGSIPLAAFVALESSFRSFAASRHDTDTSTFTRAVKESPSVGRFAVFLRVWDDAEGCIREVADPGQTTVVAVGPTMPLEQGRHDDFAPVAKSMIRESRDSKGAANTTAESSARSKRPWLAAILSLVLAPLGYLYLGWRYFVAFFLILPPFLLMKLAVDLSLESLAQDITGNGLVFAAMPPLIKVLLAVPCAGNAWLIGEVHNRMPDEQRRSLRHSVAIMSELLPDLGCFYGGAVCVQLALKDLSNGNVIGFWVVATGSLVCAWVAMRVGKLAARLIHGLCGYGYVALHSGVLGFVRVLWRTP